MSGPSEDTIAVAKPKSITEQLEPTVTKAKQARQLQVKPSLFDFARSHASNWTPPLPVTPEPAAIATLKVYVPNMFYGTSADT
jgi:hypothetical protein